MQTTAPRFHLLVVVVFCIRCNSETAVVVMTGNVVFCFHIILLST